MDIQRHHKLIQHSYRSFLKYFASVHGFCFSNTAACLPEVEDQKEKAVEEDILLLCIHARDLMENTIKVTSMKHMKITCMYNGVMANIQITRILSVMVHSKMTQVFRRDYGNVEEVMGADV